MTEINIRVTTTPPSTIEIVPDLTAENVSAIAQPIADMAASSALAQALRIDQNLADLANAATARANLGTAADNVPFLNFGAGAVASSLQSALRDRVPSVSDYGVGTHGVVGAFERARDAIKAEFPEGNTLFVPAGDWIVDSTVVIDGPGIIVAGAGHGGTRILNGTTNTSALQLGNPVGASTWRLGARDLVFGAASGIVSVGGSSGLRVENASDVRLHNIETYAFPAALHRGVVFNNVYLAMIDRVITSGALDIGQVYQNVASLAFLSAESLENDGAGFEFAGVEGIWGQNVHAFGNGTQGFRFVNDASRNNKNNFMTSWIGDTSGDHNWFIENLQNSILTSCWAATQLSTAVNTTANGFLLVSNKVFGLQFIGGQAGNNNGNGVTLLNNGTAPRDIAFTGFDFGPNETELPSNGRGGAGTGLSADAACTDITVEGGRNIGNPSGAFSASGIARIKNVRGYVNERQVQLSGSTDASGDYTFAHGMNETPVVVASFFDGTFPVVAQPTSITSTDVTLRVNQVASGAAITSSPIGLWVQMRGARA